MDASSSAVVLDSKFDVVAGLGLLIRINVKVMVNIEMDCCSICMYAYFMR